MSRVRTERGALAFLIALSAAFNDPSAVALHLGVAVVGTARYGVHFAPVAVASALVGFVLGPMLQGVQISPDIGLAALGIAVAAVSARLLAPDPKVPAYWRDAAWLIVALVLLPATLYTCVANLLRFPLSLPQDIAGCLFALPLLGLPPVSRWAALGCAAGLGLGLVLSIAGGQGPILLAAVLTAAAALVPFEAALALVLGAGLALSLTSAGLAPALAATALAALVIALMTEARRIAFVDAEERAQRRGARLRYLLRSRDEATALAVHDLQSPIEAMGGMHRTLMHMLEQDHQDTQAMKRALGIAAETTEELSSRIGSILSADRAHLGFGGSGDRLATVVDQALAAHRMRLAEKNIALSVERIPEIAIAHADDVRDVLDVLIDNALVHTPPAGRIEITLSRQPDILALYVADSGPGVPKDRQAGLFLQSAKSGEGRRGMGLYLAARRARVIGGSLAYAPSPLGGAMFVLRLREVT